MMRNLRSAKKESNYDSYENNRKTKHCRVNYPGDDFIDDPDEEGDIE